MSPTVAACDWVMVVVMAVILRARAAAWNRPFDSPPSCCEAVLDGEDGGAGAGAAVDLVVDRGEVVLDGAGGDAEAGCDLLVGEAAGGEAQDVDLAVGQAVRPG